MQNTQYCYNFIYYNYIYNDIAASTWHPHILICSKSQWLLLIAACYTMHTSQSHTPGYIMLLLTLHSSHWPLAIYIYRSHTLHGTAVIVYTCIIYTLAEVALMVLSYLEYFKCFSSTELILEDVWWWSPGHGSFVAHPSHSDTHLFPYRSMIGSLWTMDWP